MLPNDYFTLSRRSVVKGLISTPLLIPGVTSARTLGPNQGIQLRDTSGESIINDALYKKDYWKDSNINKYNGQNYEEIRTKKMKKGYLCRVSGYGTDGNLPAKHVGDTVFWHQNKLPQHMDGAMTAVLLDSGKDPVVNSDFTDIYLLADFDFFYGEYYQRMYKFTDQKGRLLYPFELLKKEYVPDGSKWADFSSRRSDAIKEAKKLNRWRKRWFNGILPITELFGIYVVEKITDKKSHVTMIAKLRFGEGTGFFAQVGSEIPFVLRSGLQNGFDGCVDIVKHLRDGKYSNGQ